MKKHLITLALLLSCTAAFAGTDCTKNSEACAAEAKKLSPFIEASLRESVPPHTENAAKKTAAAPAVAISSPAAAAGMPAETGGRLSSPAWLLLVLAGFTGLYFYLRGGIRKRRRK